MINILKQFEEWATVLQRDKFSLATFKLTVVYVASAAVILFASSLAILVIFAPPETELPFVHEPAHIELEHSEWSSYELREHLTGVIFLVDFIILVLVSIFAHAFARRTLLPIKRMYHSQQQFMSDVAHELRTPLAVVKIGADVILKKPRPVSEYQEFVTDVQAEAERLTRLSNQLLQLLKGSQSTPDKIHEENISQLLLTQIKLFTPYAHDRGIKLMSNVPDTLIAKINKDSFIEVVQNLLKNAIDYNLPQGTVTTTVTQQLETIELEVADTGIGIAPDMQKIIFDRFTKVDFARTHSDVHSGAGLGLAIVQSLVDQMNGTIILESAPQKGTRIKVVIPR